MTTLDENGNIPAGQACPFLLVCEMRCGRCPDTLIAKARPYSCAAARAHSLIRNMAARVDARRETK